MNMIKHSKLTTSVAWAALGIALTFGAFTTADAFKTRDTVLAEALQSVGLCNPLDTVALVTPIPTGATGADGSNGEAGSNGLDGVDGETGEKGATGDKGAAGSDGSAGSAGSAGKDGKDGSDGTNGKNGNDGATGANGATGSTGATGATGATGSTGLAGVSGATGTAGATGAAGLNGVCDLTQILPVNGDLLPSLDNAYTLGSLTNRWKSLQLGPGTLWIQDSEVTPAKQVGITVKSGALLLDGADSLRIGNIRLTETGLSSEDPNGPLTLGGPNFANYVELQSGGIKFKDGTIQSTAASGSGNGTPGPQGPAGPVGPAGVKGDTGATGAKGEPGTVEGFLEVPVCIDNDNNGVSHMAMFYGTCIDLKIKGTDIVMLQRNS